LTDCTPEKKLIIFLNVGSITERSANLQ